MHYQRYAQFLHRGLLCLINERYEGLSIGKWLLPMPSRMWIRYANGLLIDVHKADKYLSIFTVGHNATGMRGYTVVWKDIGVAELASPVEIARMPPPRVLEAYLREWNTWAEMPGKPFEGYERITGYAPRVLEV